MYLAEVLRAFNLMRKRKKPFRDVYTSVRGD